MNVFNFFNSMYRKLLWVIDFIKIYVSPIYAELVTIVKEVQSSDLTDDAKRKKVFQDITNFIQKKGLSKIPDSILNCIIELVYQLVKREKA